MTDRIGSGYVFTIFVFCLFSFVLVPFVLPIVVVGFEKDTELKSWAEGIYHIVNGIAMLGVLRRNMADSAFRVRMKLKSFMITVGIAFALMLIVRELAGILMSVANLNMISIYDIYPISEFDVLLTSGYMVGNNLIFDTVCMTLFAPVAVTGLFYASGFAPNCLTYLSVWLI